jgi:sugar lactone lactonase YvrE
MTASQALGSPEYCLDLSACSNGPAITGHSRSRRTPLLTRVVICCLSMLFLGDIAQVSLEAQTAYFSGAVTSLGGGFKGPSGVALDASGNLYVADSLNNAVYEIPPGCASASCVITLGGGFAQPYGVAVDASGNVYVADTDNGTLKEMPPGCTSLSCVTLVPGFSGGPLTPTGVTLDASGNLYFTSGHGVWEIPVGCSSSACFISLAPFTAAFQFYAPYGVAVDESGNLYVTDIDFGVYELPHGCTTADYTNKVCTQTQLGGNFSFNSPYAVAVDSSGNVYVAAEGVYEMPPGCISATCVTQVAAGFGNPTEGLALDGSGNI